MSAFSMRIEPFKPCVSGLFLLIVCASYFIGKCFSAPFSIMTSAAWREANPRNDECFRSSLACALSPIHVPSKISLGEKKFTNQITPMRALTSRIQRITAEWTCQKGKAKSAPKSVRQKRFYILQCWFNNIIYSVFKMLMCEWKSLFCSSIRLSISNQMCTTLKFFTSYRPLNSLSRRAINP